MFAYLAYFAVNQAGLEQEQTEATEEDGNAGLFSLRSLSSFVFKIGFFGAGARGRELKLLDDENSLRLTAAQWSRKVPGVSSTIAAPVEWIESVGNLHFPAKADSRL